MAMLNFTSKTAQIRNCRLGVGVVIVEPSNLYECTVGDGCFIGPFVEIQRGVIIGDQTKIQSHSFVCELVQIDERVFVGHGVMFVNDLFASGGPAGGDSSLWKGTHIESDVSIGSNATILPVKICGGCVIGAGSVVTKDLTIPGVYAGNPARLIRKFGE
jgi:acetyltransferase-like isoleucine patch superfamily enzyme